jgi:lipid-binding SYLF domain-containing protein
MIMKRRGFLGSAMSTAAMVSLGSAGAARADKRDELNADALQSLHKLESTEKRARFFSRHAKAVLVFPSILKAGFIFGGQTGNGVLFVHGRPDSYYNLTGGSWGLQIGGQDFAYALYFMNDGALGYLHKSGGFSAGTGPSIVVVNKGAGAAADTTTVTQDVYAFPYGQKGLMADLTLQGTKITEIHPK